MSYILMQIFFCLLIAALLGMVIGWLMCKSGCKKVYSNTEEDTEKNTKKVTTQNTEKIETANALDFLKNDANKYNDSNKDNLQLIKGVGKTLEKVLNEKGVFKFEQIASWSPEQAAMVDEVIAFPGRIEREGWVSQCKKLAQGHETEFSKRVAKGEVPTSNA